MGKYKPYPEYKDSGVEWLGDVPTHWAVRKLKYLIRNALKYGANASGVDYSVELPRYIRITDFDESGRLNEDSKLSLSIDNCNEYEVSDGDLLFARSGATVGKVFQCKGLKEHSCFAGYLIKAESNTRKILSDFLYLFTQSFEYECWKNLILNKATIENIGADKYSQLTVTTPPISEQNQIAAFLDHETAKIDRLIEKQEKLIELLKEKRQAVISHAVTKGLNPDAPMKDSGVEWLGEVPAHWNIKRFKHLFKIRKRIAGKAGLDVLSITQKGIKKKDIVSGDGQLSMDYSKYQLVFEGDFAMNHMDLLTGFVDVSKFNGVTSPDYRVFTLEYGESSKEYWLYLLQLCYMNKIFYPLGRGAAHIGRWRLPSEAFNEFKAPCPPKEEQQLIVIHVRKNVERIHQLLNKAEGIIAVMKERRTALISAAVTGKIDVRDWNKD